MKKISLFFVFLMLTGFLTWGQNPVTTTTTIYPDKDAMIHTSYPTQNFGTFDRLSATASSSVTAGINNFNHRSFIEFNLNGIPANATITSATFTMYGISHSPVSQPNASWLCRVTESWLENSVTWSNQPLCVSTDQIVLANSTSATQNYALDVKLFVQNWVSGVYPNNGLELRLQNEVKHRALSFASSDYATVAKRPVLVVTYTVPTTTVSIIPTKDAFVMSKNPISNYGTYAYLQADYNSVAPVSNNRSFIGFDLSEIPVNALITEAKLKLSGYNHTGTNNACVLQLVNTYWESTTLTWNNQPTTSPTGQILIPHTSLPQQNDIIDIKYFVNGWVKKTVP